MTCCTLYTDGSGNHSWHPPFGKSPHRFHTLAGLIIKPEEDLAAKNEVEKILSKHIPTDTRKLRNDSEYELHFDAIKSARGIYRKINREERHEIIDEVFDLILKMHPIAIASTVDKVKEYDTWGERAFKP